MLDMRNWVDSCYETLDTTQVTVNTVMNLEAPSREKTLLPLGGEACTFNLVDGTELTTHTVWTHTIIYGAGTLSMTLSLVLAAGLGRANRRSQLRNSE